MGAEVGVGGEDIFPAEVRRHVGRGGVLAGEDIEPGPVGTGGLQVNFLPWTEVADPESGSIVKRVSLVSGSGGSEVGVQVISEAPSVGGVDRPVADFTIVAERETRGDEGAGVRRGPRGLSVRVDVVVFPSDGQAGVDIERPEFEPVPDGVCYALQRGERSGFRAEAEHSGGGRASLVGIHLHPDPAGAEYRVGNRHRDRQPRVAPHVVPCAPRVRPLCARGWNSKC